MENDELEAKLDFHQAELGTLAREADRRLADVNHRLEVLASRGSMIIGAAAIASGVQISQDASVWLVCSVIASLAAAVLAIPLLRFRRGQEVNAVYTALSRIRKGLERCIRFSLRQEGYPQ